jgi:hypothetical protein
MQKKSGEFTGVLELSELTIMLTTIFLQPSTDAMAPDSKQKKRLYQ